MNWEWIYSLASGVVTAIVSYWLGLKKSRRDILREYIIRTVREEYPNLYSEMKTNTERLDNLLTKTDVKIEFKNLNKFYRRGLFSFAEKHHHDLFSSLNHFRTNILPKFKELNELIAISREEISKSWADYLRKALRKHFKIELGPDFGEAVSSDLMRPAKAYYVLPYLLNGEYDAVKVKIRDRISETLPPYLYSEEDVNKISKDMIKISLPTIKKLLDFYNKLKEESDEIVKEELLPALQKYIKKPI